MSIDLSTLGLDPTGSVDATATLNAALATGQDCVNGPIGTFKITDKLIVPVAGQKFHWNGYRSQLIVDSSVFNMSATGVIEAAAGIQPGPDLKNFNITCRQPDTSNPSLFHPYPPAINLQDSPRTVIDDVQLIAATTGIAFRGNCGGSYSRRLQASALNCSVFIEAALDTMRIGEAHIWPFGLTANQIVAFSQPGCLGILSLRCDGLALSDALTLCGTGLQTQPGSAGTTFGTATGCGFDTFNGYNNLGCASFNFVGGYFTPGGTGTSVGIGHNGPGSINCSGVDFGGGIPGGAYGMIGVTNAAAYLNLVGCDFESGGSNRAHIVGVDGDITATGNRHNRSVGSYGNQTYQIYSGCRLTANGNVQNPFSSGTAAFLYLQGGDAHQICNNVARGTSYGGPGYTSPGPNTRISNNV